MNYQIAILVGGHSTEFDASILSYENVIESCLHDSSTVKVTEVFFIKENSIFIHKANFPKCASDLSKGGKKVNILSLPRELSKTDLYILNLLHGNEGEDGSIQGLADIYSLKGSFGSVIASSLSMNKWQMSEVVSSVTRNMVKNIPYIKVTRDTQKADLDQFLRNSNSAYFVYKPNRLGASLFTKKLKKEEVLGEINKHKEWFDFSTEFLLQEYIDGREFTVGVVQNRDETVVLPIVEVFTKDNFLGHDEKHQKGKVSVEFDKLEAPLKEKLSFYSKFIFKEIGFMNFCRFDFIVFKDELFFLEANSIPGLMKSSIFPKMLEKGGLSIPQMIQLFVDNYNQQQRLQKKYRYHIDE